MIGSTLFYVQRYSAVYLLAYTIWVVSFLIANNPLEYNLWTAFTNQLDFLVLTSSSSCCIHHSCFYWFMDYWN
jgi:succinate dehydrogenase hydrophobic anchor subunit